MDLKSFTLGAVLNEDSRTKSINLCLDGADGKRAVALIEKLPLKADSVFSNFKNDTHELIDSNDIYYRFANSQRDYECKLIFPATAAHIAKYSEQKRKLIAETLEMHQKITRPFFAQLHASGQVAWIQNILEDRTEMERRLVDIKSPHDGNGFIILPDYKWIDESNVNSLYLLVIVRRTDLWCIRDLGAAELPFLLSIRSEIKKLFAPEAARYKFPDGSPVTYEHLRIYFHYPPTYPHLHIHIVLAGSTAMEGGAAVGQAILLDDVIDNIQNIDPDYYRLKRTLTMQFGVEHELYKQLSSFNSQ